MQLKTCTLKEFQKVAHEFISNITPLQSSATVVGLYGDLGSGKTTFVQAAAKALGVTVHISSPTFLIWRRFTIQNSRFKNLIHADCYRLKNAAELRKLRFADLLADPANLIFIEWADRVADLLPPHHLKISFELIDEESRKLTFN